MMYAHSLAQKPHSLWEPLEEHLLAVGSRASSFASMFGWAETARVTGMLHDIGKASALFQSYIAQDRADAGGATGPDHSSAGARQASAYPHPLGRILAVVIAGHHAGLGDGEEIDRRLAPDRHRIEDFQAWRELALPVPDAAQLRPPPGWSREAKAFSDAFLTRMLFSCLVDADFLETEAFHCRAEGRPIERGGHTELLVLRDRLRRHMAILDGQGNGTVAAVRSRVLKAAVAKATASPGLFTMTVPTGGGKTLASLSFALEHAARHGLRRVIHVAPFTAIIEQTADVFRTALETDADVLEHHAQFDWPERDEEEGRSGLGKLRRASENWDVPVVVTTAVQLFESLFANRTSRCRKLHNLARSVIILDEAQALPLPVLRPCMEAIKELARNYGATIVLCTATQPALRQKDCFEGGFAIDEDREIAPEPAALYAALKRVRVEKAPAPVTDAEIAARFAERPQMLCIVNSRRHARDLFDAIREQPGALHLSTLMVPKHRRAVLEEVRRRVKDGEPVRLVSTSLIEAGVDLDLLEVWRAEAGLDSIAQAAGRCNRNGKPVLGRVVVFEPADAKPPRALAAFWAAAQPVLRRHDDVLGLAAMRAYFQELYFQKGAEALDAVMIGDQRGVLPVLAAHAKDRRFPFRTLGSAFRLIEDAMEPVVVPVDEEARGLLRGLAAAERPPGGLLRRLHGYAVSIPPAARRAWLAQGVLAAVHPALGDGLLAFADDAHYRAETGLDLVDASQREAERNVF